MIHWIRNGVRNRFVVGLDESMLWFARTQFSHSVREGLVWLIPCILLIQGFTLLEIVLGYLGLAQELRVSLRSLTSFMSLLMPTLGLIAVSYVAALHYRLPRGAVAAACLLFSAIFAAAIGEAKWAKALEYTLAFAIPILCIPILSWLQRSPWTEISKNQIAGGAVGDSLNLVVPVLCCGLVVFIIGLLVRVIVTSMPTFDLWPLMNASSLSLASIYTIGNSLLWFFGVHGYQALLPVLGHLDVATYGGATVINTAFLGAFVFIGGSGATFSLILAILLVEKNKPWRFIAFASIPLAVFNINEFVLFGLPIILNPRLFIPFLIVPTVNLLVSTYLTDLGWVQPVANVLPFNSPVIFNALAVTKGDVGAVVLQIVNVLLGAIIYAPFLSRTESRVAAEKPNHSLLLALKRDAPPNFNENALIRENPLAERMLEARKNTRFREEFSSLHGFDFVLEYQPQISLRSGKITTLEALIRLSNGSRQIYPGDFLHLFSGTELSVDLDLWVLEHVCQQILVWDIEGADAPRVAVNLCRETLCSDAAVARIVQKLKLVPDRIVIELTEQSFAGDLEKVFGGLVAIRQAGAKVFIDDFGTGYSALSYLHTLEVDGIKIDRSFVLAAQRSDRARHLCQAVINLSKSLEMAIVVEGVEEAEQITRLDLNADSEIQGWLISKSLPVYQVVDFVQKWNGEKSSAFLSSIGRVGKI